ncbi:HPr kinase/phosphorylase [Candidatus Kinetoplastibacterium desouzaii TCC079E]|uniref:HPr kinase/phosphorylase n=1 Tax=Candidatus Kinetoplastidibacterium desouzai TCC079E TaxID=1208919 RepID=M1LVC1_9PROT|nr:HPr(Ser) kinase/phosphatase [Candidatus Kinetoplastibacterium desouzaii]AGF47204.1 HPr kinase/phosphorylase [Candidatus Kinetoplastibacterium desouzaii TCC079E]
MITIQNIILENSNEIEFNWVTGQESSNKPIFSDNKESAVNLVGHLNLIHPGRIQVIGNEELEYYNRLSAAGRMYNVKELITGNVPAILVANNLTIPEDLIEKCSHYNIPLLSTKIDAAQLIDLLRSYIGKKLAPTEIIHGVFLDVFGIGVLIIGESGLGKSELALELISRGHGLIADDAVELFQVSPNVIEGKCPPLLQNLLEVRGLGLLDIKTIYGEIAVRRKMRLKLIVHLLRTVINDNYERLPLQYDIAQDILGVPVRKVMIQVAAGRNLAVIVEAAVRNMILKMRGIDTLEDFMERQAIAILHNQS